MDNGTINGSNPSMLLTICLHHLERPPLSIDVTLAGTADSTASSVDSYCTVLVEYVARGSAHLHWFKNRRNDPNLVCSHINSLSLDVN